MRNTVLVLGTQWGDEGKGKIIDFLAEKSDIVVRYNGGNNAGHTVKVGEDIFKLHIMPSGCVQGKKCIIGNGLVIDPDILIGEIDSLKKTGRNPDLMISGKAHVILEHHKIFDAGREREAGKGKIGTTGRGIGPAYSDKAKRTEALRVHDLVGENFREKINNILELKKHDLVRFGVINSESELDDYKEKIAEKYSRYADVLRPYAGNVPKAVNTAIESGKNVLFEGAQGTLLDVDHGTYPYVTSSNSTAGGVCTGTGVGPDKIGNIIGVVKAYTTRVGEGPFPTELTGETGSMLREAGAEFGTTTGRPRRCGWLDIVIVNYAKMINGLKEIALTKLDVLSGLKKLKICTGYEIDGKETVDFPVYLDVLTRAKPVYEEMEGWENLTKEQIIEICRNGFTSLPEQARRYVKRIEELTGLPATIVSLGPERSATIIR